MLEKLQVRIKELTSALEQSAANHNGLLGALNEAKKMYDDMLAAAPAVEQIVKDVEEIV